MSTAVHPRHLLIFIHSLAGGGAERVAVNLANSWSARDWRVTVVTQADTASDTYTLSPGVERLVLGTEGASGNLARGVWANVRRLWRLRRLIRRYRPDVVLGIMSTASILSVVAAQGLGCRVIATEHRHPPAQAMSRVWQRLRRWAYPRAWRVVTLTTATADWITQQVPGSRAVVIPNAVNWPLSVSEPVLEPPAQSGRRCVLAVGRLHPVKGFDLLLAAFQSIAHYFPDWDLIILGEGPERARLEEHIAVAGLEGRVLLPGRVGNIGQWYEIADIYVLSSRTEGLSNTLLEAMASGLPVVAYDCDTGPREIIRPGIDGVLVQPVADSEALAAHLSDLMAHEERRQILARRAVDVRDRFSTTRIMALWEEVFGERP